MAVQGGFIDEVRNRYPQVSLSLEPTSANRNDVHLDGVFEYCRNMRSALDNGTIQLEGIDLGTCPYRIRELKE